MHEINKVYNTHFDIEYKDDDSPVTLADRNADKTIRSYLQPSGYYVMSEEEPVIPYPERKTLSRLWIVDPLDGTKEFVKRNGEFTTNIALIEDGIPVIGIVGLPVHNLIYFGAKGLGSGKIRLSVHENTDWYQPLPFSAGNNPPRLIASRSHKGQATDAYVALLEKKYGKMELLTFGSSLKLCKVAEGQADIYPRISPISEWDVAAGHAILKYAGGHVLNPFTYEEITYNKENLEQYPFVAVRKGINLP